MSLKTCSLLLATVGLAAAQSSVVSLFIPFADPQPLVASVMGESAGTTTYSINCPAGTDSSDCGMGPGLYMTAGPTTMRYSMSEPAEDFYDSILCSLGGTTTAACTEMASGTGANFPGTETGTFAKTDITMLAVTVTAGPTATSASTTTDSKHTSSTDKTGTTEAAGTTGSGSSTSGAASTSQASATSTGGLSRVTGHPGVALGGAAIALVAAAL
ncbi:GPI anchored protein [Penicillium sp. IBT 35674x]|nr:GPI anchored protein [Penicillium sp. IBT 35674x]